MLLPDTRARVPIALALAAACAPTAVPGPPTVASPATLAASADPVDPVDRARVDPVLTHEPLRSGAQAQLAVDGALAFDTVVFVAGSSPGGGVCPPVLGGVCLGVAGASVIGRAQADAAGHASLSWRVPGSAAGRVLALQAAIPRGVGGADSVVTAVVEAQVDGFDADADGYDAALDCDDGDPAVHPGADEVCDGVDTDCDPSTTEDGLVSIGAVSYATIGDALWVAAPDATVQVCAGTWSEALVSERPVNLVGVAGAARTTIDAGGAGVPALTVDGVGVTVVDGLTVTGGTPGIALGDGVTLTVRHSVVRGNTNPSGGGGIAGRVNAAVPPIVTLDDVELADNHSDAYGGGLYLWHGALTATDVVFRGNSAELDGGGVHLTWGVASFSGGAFFANRSATGLGGGLTLSSIEGDVPLDGVDFGTGADDNLSDDVYVLTSGDRYTWFAAGTSVTCLATSPYTCQ